MVLQLLWLDPRKAQGRKKRRLTILPRRGLPKHVVSTQDLTGAGLLWKAGRAGTAPRSPSKLGEELGWDRLQVSWLPLGRESPECPQIAQQDHLRAEGSVWPRDRGLRV